MSIDVPPPATTIPTSEQFYSKTDPTKPDAEFLKAHFMREGRLSEEQALFILTKGNELLKKEPNLLEIDAPITGECVEGESRFREGGILVPVKFLEGRYSITV